MKAVRFTAVNTLEYAEIPDPACAPGEVLVRLKAAALNHRDLWILKGQYAGLRFPVTPGSDGAGVVEKVGAGVAPGWKGREVIINPAFNWGENQRTQGNEFNILGLPRDGTLAELIAVPLSQVTPKPAHLSWEEAAALPLAGLTAWRCLFARAGLKSGEKLLISGVGGGVALFALQLALAAGAKVWVTSGSHAKLDQAIEMGARGGFCYRDEGWAKSALRECGGFDVILDSAGGPGFGDLIDLAAPAARVVFFGATRGDPPVLPMRKVFWRQISLLGSTMGSPADWDGLMQDVERHKIQPVVSARFSLKNASDAFTLMANEGQFGKIVLKP